MSEHAIGSYEYWAEQKIAELERWREDIGDQAFVEKVANWMRSDPGTLSGAATGKLAKDIAIRLIGVDRFNEIVRAQN